MKPALIVAALFAAFSAIAGLARAEAIWPIIRVWPIDAKVAFALDDASEAFSDAWEAGDIDRLAAAYTEDAVLHPPAGGVLTTPEDIRALWAPLGNQSRIGHSLRPTLRQNLGGGEVLEMGRWHTVRSDDSGTFVSELSGCYTVIWRNDEGRWRMRYDSWTEPNDNEWACRPT